MPRRALVAFGIDVFAVVLFVAIGRRSHDEGGSAIAGVVEVGAPFLIALAIGWVVSRAWRQPTTLQTGLAVWLTTVIIGLILRRTVFDRGTATAFVVVATLTLGVVLLGWRAICNALRARRMGRGSAM